jgi:N-methylhydantoinase A
VGLIVAVDTGGTFTDLVAYDTGSGDLTYTKSLTTYGDLVGGVMDAVAKGKVDLGKAEVVKFGTTLVINTYIQRNGARTALITTEGFRDTLELRRGNRPFAFDLHYHREPVLVERELRFEVKERIGADGATIAPLDKARLAELATLLKSLDIEAVAVSFINSYVDSRHEDETVAFLREHLPGIYITAGTELSREWYEYERTSTAAANAYVGPRLQDYVGRLEDRLRHEGFERTFFMMASNGGVFSVARAKQQPVMLVESGPVGGCIGACSYARELGIQKLIAFDMGGTTAKCAVVENASFDIKSPYYVGGYDYGFPIHGAVLDIVEVGAGGGSIAWIDPQGRLSVGPLSAGSDPGPVAYGRGGQKPTITDANLTLGRIDAASFLGGEMTLDTVGAAQVIREQVADPLGFKGDGGLDEASAGIIALGVVTMAGAIRQITIERGMDPREFTLFAFGGGGPLHAGTLARELNIPEVIIPPEPGNFSAIGMLVSDARVDETHTFLRDFTQEAIDEMTSTFGELEKRLSETLAGEIGSVEIGLQRAAEMRYRGQKQGIRAEVGTATDPAAIREIFNRTYLRRYGHVDEQAPVEFVSLYLTGSARIKGPGLADLRPDSRRQRPGAQERRPVYFTERGARVDTPVYQRGALNPGFEAAGPAIIEEYGSTTIVGPDDRFRVGTLSEIRITFNSTPKAAS